jgi:hypothetical protein
LRCQIIDLLLFGVVDFDSVGVETFVVRFLNPFSRQFIPLSKILKKTYCLKLGAQRGAAKAMLGRYLNQESQKY